jgi:hypothetical protein
MDYATGVLCRMLLDLSPGSLILGNLYGPDFCAGLGEKYAPDGQPMLSFFREDPEENLELAISRGDKTPAPVSVYAQWVDGYKRFAGKFPQIAHLLGRGEYLSDVLTLEGGSPASTKIVAVQDWLMSEALDHGYLIYDKKTLEPKATPFSPVSIRDALLKGITSSEVDSVPNFGDDSVKATLIDFFKAKLSDDSFEEEATPDQGVAMYSWIADEIGEYFEADETDNNELSFELADIVTGCILAHSAFDLPAMSKFDKHLVAKFQDNLADWCREANGKDAILAAIRQKSEAKPDRVGYKLALSFADQYFLYLL